MKKKFKVTFLIDKTNNWIEKYLKKYNFKLSKKYQFYFSKNYLNVKNQDIVFPLSYTKILPNSFLNKNNLVIIAHASKLPEDRGFAPIQYQILKKKNSFCISLIKAVSKVDAGPICMQNFFKLKGDELIDEIRKIQAMQILNLINNFLLKFPKIKFKKQKVIGNFNKKRQPKDSQLNINKSIKQQFNLLRINDNELYPSFFYFKGKKYLLKIYKS